MLVEQFPNLLPALDIFGTTNSRARRNMAEFYDLKGNRYSLKTVA
jgi:hypothetical protein